MGAVMSAANFGNSLALVLSYEGGFSDRPDDPGGATCWGVTLATLSAYRGRACTVDDVKALTRAEVGPIYTQNYWDVISGDLLPVGVDTITFDAAVNQGPGTAARMLQEAAGVAADGQIGPATLKALATTPAVTLIERIRLARLARYRQSDGWPAFGLGWSRRANSIAQTATAWATKAAASPVTTADPMEASRAATGEG